MIGHYPTVICTLFTTGQLGDVPLSATTGRLSTLSLLKPKVPNQYRRYRCFTPIRRFCAKNVLFCKIKDGTKAVLDSIPAIKKCVKNVLFCLKSIAIHSNPKNQKEVKTRLFEPSWPLLKCLKEIAGFEPAHRHTTARRISSPLQYQIVPYLHQTALSV